MTGPDIHVVTAKELAAMRLLLPTSIDYLSVSSYKIADVLGVHFRAGEWGKQRCGSVFTCVFKGRSVYGRVDRFLKMDGMENEYLFASVVWFSVPTYPFGNPLVVEVTLDGSKLDREIGCVIPVTVIDPSRVMVEMPQPGCDVYRMMRDSGYDTKNKYL